MNGAAGTATTNNERNDWAQSLACDLSPATWVWWTARGMSGETREIKNMA